MPSLIGLAAFESTPDDAVDAEQLRSIFRGHGGHFFGYHAILSQQGVGFGYVLQLISCLLAYHPAKRLKRPRGLTPHEFVCAQWQKNPAIFTRDPTHLTLGVYI
ncbi:hypothetical protein IC235_19130 [Hymenobacter sp. BT664]|uniref:Uncharacterized protein n=1 Tax=Hymenobacter montanus TaxID=2771359 RepID=A0A927GLB1_9BACT|nr:hypothetical protein [Hymenobacter montanus]MBD2770006.1 hypothetical protein [Hymenobacter montanus]